jgi:hypothetical protein
VENLEEGRAMTSPTDHDLNKLLADVAGVNVCERRYDDDFAYWHLTCEGEVGDEWNPLEDANQMMVVKREMSVEYLISFAKEQYTVFLYHPKTKAFGNSSHPTEELRAVGLAIWAMERGES